MMKCANCGEVIERDAAGGVVRVWVNGNPTCCVECAHELADKLVRTGYAFAFHKTRDADISFLEASIYVTIIVVIAFGTISFLEAFGVPQWLNTLLGR